MQVFHQAGPSQRVDCLPPVDNTRKISFTETQQRIASSGIEAGVSNRRFTNWAMAARLLDVSLKLQIAKAFEITFKSFGLTHLGIEPKTLIITAANNSKSHYTETPNEPMI